MISFDPAVSLPDKLAVAPEVCPVTVSPVVNAFEFVIKYVSGLVVLISKAWVPLVAPTIVSPLTKVPEIPVTENCGSLGSTLALSDSNTACNL